MAKKKGKYKRISNTIKTICKTEPIRLPVVKKPLIIGGIVQVATVLVDGTKPVIIAEYATTTLTMGAKIKGTNSITFNTTGKPNMVGSFILKSPGTTVIGANTLVCLLVFFLRAKYPITRTKPIVAPHHQYKQNYP